MNGLDNLLLHRRRRATTRGTATITLTFEAGTNPDIAQVQVQNKLQLATPLLPQAVQQQGVQVTKSSSNFLIVVGVRLRRTAACPVRPRRLRRLARAGSDQPHRRRGRRPRCSARSTPCASGSIRTSSPTIGLTPVDVSTAIKDQNVAGRGRRSWAALPAVPGQLLNATITGADAAANAGAVRRHPAAGQPRRLAGAACATSRASSSAAKTTPSTRATTASRRRASASSSRPARTRCDTANAVRAKVDELSAYLPAGLKVDLSVRHDALRAHLDQGSGEDADRSHRARLPRDVSVPAEPARHADPDDRRAGRAARHVRRHGGRRLLDQHADDVRPRARDRPARRRRDRGRRERRARDARRKGLSPQEATRKSMDQITGALVGIGARALARCSCRWRSSADRSA